MEIDEYQSIKAGFTLIELLVAASLVGLVSVVSVKLLFSTVVSTARQQSIQVTSQDVQVLVDSLTKTLKESKRVIVTSPSEISTEGSTCLTYRLVSHSIEMAEDTAAECVIPTSGFTKLTSDNTYVDSFSITKSDYEISIAVSGHTKDPFGKHDFSYTTSVVKRTD